MEGCPLAGLGISTFWEMQFAVGAKSQYIIGSLTEKQWKDQGPENHFNLSLQPPVVLHCMLLDSKHC